RRGCPSGVQAGDERIESTSTKTTLKCICQMEAACRKAGHISVAQSISGDSQAGILRRSTEVAEVVERHCTLSCARDCGYSEFRNESIAATTVRGLKSERGVRYGNVRRSSRPRYVGVSSVTGNAIRNVITAAAEVGAVVNRVLLRVRWWRVELRRPHVDPALCAGFVCVGNPGLRSSHV